MIASPLVREEVTFFTEKALRMASLMCASHIPHTIPAILTVVLIMLSQPFL
jgi:hypothetical protein